MIDIILILLFVVIGFLPVWLWIASCWSERDVRSGRALALWEMKNREDERRKKDD